MHEEEFGLWDRDRRNQNPRPPDDNGHKVLKKKNCSEKNVTNKENERME